MKKYLLSALIMCSLLANLVANSTSVDDFMDYETSESRWTENNGYQVAPPVIDCPADEVISCEEYASYTPPPIETAGTECAGTQFEIDYEVVEGTCDSTYAYYITYTYNPVHGACFDSDPCSMVVFVEKETLADVVMPVNYDGLPGNEAPLSCTGGYAVDSYGNPSPSVTGEPGGSTGGCAQILTSYYDNILPLCGGSCITDYSSYKVVRNWTIVEWCTNTTIFHTQTIKVMDTEAPIIGAIADMTVSTDPWSCGATIPLPYISAVDNCTSNSSINISFSSTDGVQVGNTIILDDPAQTPSNDPVIITVTASDCCGNFSTEEIEVTVVDLVPPVTNAESVRTIELSTDGIGHIFASSFDDGSYDNCGTIDFMVKRMDNGGPCASFDLFGNGLGLTANGVDDNAEFNEVVHFCCADVGDPVMVNFKVCDDGDANGIIGTAGDNCNSSMVEVIVQEKLAPVINCPSDRTISCVELASLGDLQLLDDDFLNAQFGYATASATCNVGVSQTISGSDACGEGTVFRNFTATNDEGESSTCTQFITVSAGPENLLTCDRINFADLNNNIYNWCSVNDNDNDNDDDLPALIIDCTEDAIVPELDIDIDGFCTEVGVNIEVDTFHFADGACRKFLIHYEAIDQCVFDENFVNDQGENDPFNSDNGYFEFYIEIDAFDNEAPSLDCEDITVTSQDCEGYSGTFTISGTDNCTAPSSFSHIYRFDLGADDIDLTDHITGTVILPQSLGLTRFPSGTHRIHWLVSDGCGNDATCSQLITIEEEDKQPTPYCYDGITTVVMPSTGTVDIWANDFDAGSFDNCDTILTLTMVPEQDVEGLTEVEAYNLSFTGTQQANGDYGWSFDCSYIPEGLSADLEIRMYVTDTKGNWDYCTASLRLDDNTNACGNVMPLEYEVFGDFKTESATEITEVELTVDASYPEFPMIGMFNESYSMNLIQNLDYTLTPKKNDNHLNGITTLDIVLIQKHILGLALLESPYTLIAADVDNNCEVDGLDIIQLRKLLLGKYEDYTLPNNTSWRFVESDYQFLDPSNPCVYNELSEIFNLNESVQNDFIGVKIGDINATAQMNFSKEINTRSGEALTFLVEDNVSLKGERRIEFKAKDFNEIYGFQHELTWEDARFIRIESGALDLGEHNVAVIGNSIHVSKDISLGRSIEDDEVLFSLILDVEADLKTSDILEITNTIMRSEAYVGDNLEVVDVNIAYRSMDKEYLSFELFQNEPNPFNTSTTISFVLPNSNEATLSIYDISGKLIYSKQDFFTKGMNTLVVESETISAKGLLYYQLEYAGKKSVKRMVIIE